MQSNAQLTPAERKRRILVVANETVDGPALERAIRRKAARVSVEVLVLAPALN